MATTGWRCREVVRRRIDAVALGTGLLVIVLTGLIAQSGVPGWERATFHGINDLPDQIHWFMFVWQLLGSLLVPVAVAVVALVLKKWRLALAMALLPPLKLLVERSIKQVVDRQRPAASTCGGDLDCGQFRDVPTLGNSFPSGHAVIAFAMLWLLLPYVPRRWWWAVFTPAVLVLLSRVYLGAHNPLDVVVGAAAGVVIASALNLLLGVPARHQAAALSS